MVEPDFTDPPTPTVGELPAVGDPLPEFELIGTDLRQITNETFAGTRLIISILPSIETPACQEQLRRFHEQVSQLDNTKLLSVSLDLPFTLKRFCAADGIDDVIAASAFRSDFGEKFGVTVRDSVLEGSLARSVVVADENHKVIHTQMVPGVVTELNYDEVWDILR